MNTPDIIESLNMAAISPRPLSNALLHQISAALMERDALRTENEQLTKDNKNLTAINDAVSKANTEIGQDWAKLKYAMGLVPDTNDYMGILLWHSNERDALRAENERLTAIIEASTGECLVSLPAPDTDNAKLLLANKAIARTNEQLRAALVLVDIAFQGIYGGNAYEVLPIETMTEDRKRACDAALEAMRGIGDES